MTGPTDSPDFPTVNPIQAALGGGTDAFVTKLNVAGDGLVYSTFFGRVFAAAQARISHSTPQGAPI